MLRAVWLAGLNSVAVIALFTLFHGLGTPFVLFSLSISFILATGLVFELVRKYSLARWFNCGGFLAFGTWIAIVIQLNHGEGSMFFFLTLFAFLLVTSITGLAYRATARDEQTLGQLCPAPVPLG